METDKLPLQPSLSHSLSILLHFNQSISLAPFLSRRRWINDSASLRSWLPWVGLRRAPLMLCYSCRSLCAALNKQILHLLNTCHPWLTAARQNNALGENNSRWNNKPQRNTQPIYLRCFIPGASDKFGISHKSRQISICARVDCVFISWCSQRHEAFT